MLIKGILPYLDNRSPETLITFIFGRETTNSEREAYFAGWEIVNRLLEEGIIFRKYYLFKRRKCLTTCGKNIPCYSTKGLGHKSKNEKRG